MPQIRINEVDNTVGTNLTALSNIVFIPGPLGKNAVMASNTDKLITSIAEFEEQVGKEAKEIEGDEEASDAAKEAFNKAYYFATRLLASGMYVRYYALAAVEASAMITELAAADIWESIKDKALYDLRFITSGSLVNQTINTKIKDVAESRGDVLGLIDYEIKYETLQIGSQSINKQILDYCSAYASKYCASFTPWCKFGDSIDPIELPASFGYLVAYAASVQSNPAYKAVAGVRRGQIPGLIRPNLEFGDADIKYFENHDVNMDEEGYNYGVAINPIANIRPYGYVVWGNRTLFNNGEGGLVASSFLNIRQLLINLKQFLYKAARKYTFETNSVTLWLKFSGEVSTELETMKANDGIRNYKIEKNIKLINGARVDVNVKGRLTALIHIEPIEAIEDFDLTVELADEIEVVE